MTAHFFSSAVPRVAIVENQHSDILPVQYYIFFNSSFCRLNLFFWISGFEECFPVWLENQELSQTTSTKNPKSKEFPTSKSFNWKKKIIITETCNFHLVFSRHISVKCCRWHVDTIVETACFLFWFYCFCLSVLIYVIPSPIWSSWRSQPQMFRCGTTSDLKTFTKLNTVIYCVAPLKVKVQNSYAYCHIFRNAYHFWICTI